VLFELTRYLVGTTWDFYSDRRAAEGYPSTLPTLTAIEGARTA